MLHKLVGDTINKREKIKYNLFPEVSHLEFEFAQYLTCKNGALVRIYKNDSSFYEIERSIEAYLEDVRTVIANRDREYVETVTHFKYISVNVIDLKIKKTLKLKKGKRIFYTLNGSSSEETTIKIKKIDNDNEPILFGKNSMGQNIILPLSQIKYITKMDKTLYVAMKVIGGLYCATGVAAVIENTDNLGLGISLAAFGTSTLLIKNRKYYISKSKIDVEYKK